MNKAELFYRCNNILGEGITYLKDDETLFWLDIGNISKVYKLNLSNAEKEIFEFPEIITATSIKSKNQLILVSNNGIID